jgi:Dyp-type peroxidase family
VTTPRFLLSDDARHDIQGFVTSGYGYFPLTAYVFIRFEGVVEARRWLECVLPSITTAAQWLAPNERMLEELWAVNVCFTAAGLAALRLPEEVLCTFPAEFREGMTTPARARVLGDTDASAPDRWEFGGPGSDPIHALVIVHAKDEPTMSGVLEAIRGLGAASSGAVREIAATQRGVRPAGDYEPFGFRDGVSQPRILGISETGVPTGEFILGYVNHYGLMPPTPAVPAPLDPAGILAPLDNPYHAGRRARDLGRNGSFVVYRKLRQDVAGFWQFMRQEAGRRGSAASEVEAIRLAAKCVGRWPSGAPLALSPDRDAPELATMNDFGYAADRDGRACPIGAHVRRTHPRDDLKPYPDAQSLSMSEAHRLLRRGRVYGDRSGGAAPTAFVEDGQERGLHFLCVQASLRSQFEFVQQTWCNNPHVGGLYDNKDPLIGDHGGDGQAPSHMTIPTPAGHEKTAALPRFVTVRAGAYFFMPSLRALRFLARSSI